MTGVSHGAEYPYGDLPDAGCSVSDAEDGHPSIAPALSAISGPNAADGLGSRTATCSYTDKGGLTTTVSATYTIIKAASVVTVSCDPTDVTYTGSAQTPCTAAVTGTGGLSQSASVSYTKNIDAGTATASAAYAGDPTHLGGTGSATFTIGKASSSVTLTCPSAVPWTGAPVTPCTATAAGVGGLDVALAPAYSLNTAVGTATAAASYDGDDNHTAGTGSTTFTIEKAASVVAVTCPASETYTGSAIKPCTAVATGAGGLNKSVTVTYGDNTNAGTATASASYDGDDNHTASTGSTTFTIEKAASVVAVTCPASETYTGSPIETCTAAATGVGGLNQTLTVSHTANINVGTATANATYAGDANHLGSTGSETFEITKAASLVAVTCDPTEVTYTGVALEPCSAVVTGAGGLHESLATTYADNTNAGTATANATYSGDANHLGSTGSETFEITKAMSTVTVTCSPTSVTFTGTPIEPCTARATGAGGLDTGASVSYTNNVAVGTATATGTYPGDANHTGDSDSKTFTIEHWTLKGFYAPVDMTPVGVATKVFNTVKGGSTVPLKFEVFAGTTELTSTSVVKSFKTATVTCDGSSPTDEIEITSTGGTSLRYDTTGGQFVQNWQTPKSPGCYRATVTTQDLGTIEAYFKLR